MKNPANNPLHLANRHFCVDGPSFAHGFAHPMAPQRLDEDFTDFLATHDAQDALLNDALAIGHTGTIAGALGLIARMRGMSGLAAKTGIRRQQLYRALSEDGNPTLDTLTRVTTALGYRLSAQRAEAG